MTDLPAVLSPDPGEQGLVTRDLAALGEDTVAAWDLFLDVAADVDLDATARAKGWTAREVIVHVGAWDEGRRLADILADAHAGREREVDHDAIVAGVLAAHGGAGRAEALAAIRRGRDEAAEWFSSPTAPEEARLVAPSLLGPLPVGTLVHATAYQLSVAALDLVPAGARPPEGLLTRGLTALVDSAGALAARAGVTASIAALTPQARVGSGARDGSWRTAPIGRQQAAGPAIEGDVSTVLDVTSGRAAAPVAYARGDLRTTDLTGLLRMARVMGSVAGLPGGDALRRALVVMDGVGGLLGRLPFGRRSG